MKRTVLFLSFVLFLFFDAKAQNVPSIIPPSPNAASLGKYVEAPVSLATGIPSISIPIYTINEGPISVPINLSYHAGGIKVEEVASWVGLGWSLNAGGVITRTTIGLPDDVSSGYINTTYSVESLKNEVPITSIEDDITGIIEGARDYEPDMFYFNFLGYSGKFFYDQNSNGFIQAPYSNIKIIPNYNNGMIESWMLITPDGLKYYFGKSADMQRNAFDINASNTYSTSKGSEFSTNNTDFGNHITSWYLLEIIAPTNHVVKFAYKILNNIDQYSIASETMGLFGCSSSGYSISYLQSNTNITLLDSIEFSNGTIKFIQDTIGRLDLKNTRALKKINIYDKYNLFKSFNLHYDYFVSENSLLNYRNIWNDSTCMYRLKLDKVQEENKFGCTLPPYIFEYDPRTLPERYSTAQDYWGYYNGKNDNANLIPTALVYPFIGSSFYYNGADRTADPIASQASILKRIIYPTGGSAEYLYEGNTAEAYNMVLFNLQNRSESKFFFFSRNPESLIDSGPLTYLSDTLTINNPLGYVKFLTEITDCNNMPSEPVSDCYFYIYVEGLSDPTFSLALHYTNIEFCLPPGTYRIRAVGNEYVTDNKNFTVSVWWEEDPHPSYLTIGGQRVKKTIVNDAYGETIEKTYNYDYFGDSVTSGYIVNAPIFVENDFFDGSCDPYFLNSRITSFSQASLASIQGNVLGYRNVSEVRSDGAKTEYTFDMIPMWSNIGETAGGTVYAPDLYTSWASGNLIEQKSYKQENGLDFLVQKVENIYETAQTSYLDNFGFKMINMIQCCNILNRKYKYAFYSAKSEWFRLKNTKTTSFFGSDSIVENKDFVYENNPLFASSEKSINSQNDTTIKKTFYAPELGLMTLVDEHRISEPIKVEIWKNNGALSKQLSDYYTFPSGQTLPQYIKVAKGNNIPEEKIIYYDYDNKGNPTEVSKADGTHIVYVWGYNETYPIAKIENATYSEVLSSVLNLQDKSNLDNDRTIGLVGNEGALRIALNNLRNLPSLSDALVTTYTYDPLIGVTSITDPRGETVYYEYDDFNRLEYVKDSAGNILSKNDYHYKNQ